MMNFTRIVVPFFALMMLCESAFAQMCSGGGAPATASLTLTGRNSVDGFNDGSNARGFLTVAFAGEVVGLRLTGVNLTTLNGSWCSEATIEIADIRNSVANWVDVTPSLDDNVSPCSDLPFTELFDLSDPAYRFPTNGTSIYWELFEDYDDVANVTDATYTAGTMIVYVCPTGQNLPLDLHFFNGKTMESSNILEWETLMEKDVEWHIVERSVDGIRWTETGRKAGQENSHIATTYQMEDREPIAKAYYRLRSVDFDGSENISNTIILTRQNEHFGISAVFPSPATDRVNIQFESLKEENVLLRMYDLTGRLVLEQDFSAEKGVNEMNVPLTDLAPGVYLTSLGNATSTSPAVRIIKE